MKQERHVGTYSSNSRKKICKETGWVQGTGVFGGKSGKRKRKVEEEDERDFDDGNEGCVGQEWENYLWRKIE